MNTMTACLTIAAALWLAACQENTPATAARVSGQVDATDVQVAPEVGGRIVELPVEEGDRVKRGDLIARLDTRDVDLALQHANAERAQADAQLRLLEAGSRPEDVRQAEAQAAAAGADVGAAQADLAAAETDLQRFESLLQSNSGSQKQRDDAATRRTVARDRLTAARARETAARAVVARLKAGPRRQEIDAARARVAAVDAQIATLEKSKADATVVAPVDGTITERLVDRGEMAAARLPLVIVTDLDHAWAEVFVDEPIVPRIKLRQPATVFTDAGGPALPGTVSYIASKAEFTPRNVQTAEDRSKLVFRVRIAVDNRQGILKQGMPVEAEIPFNEGTRD
jgi:HlyD family secretion protein